MLCVEILRAVCLKLSGVLFVFGYFLQCNCYVREHCLLCKSNRTWVVTALFKFGWTLAMPWLLCPTDAGKKQILRKEKGKIEKRGRSRFRETGSRIVRVPHINKLCDENRDLRFCSVTHITINLYRHKTCKTYIHIKYIYIFSTPCFNIPCVKQNDL